MDTNDNANTEPMTKERFGLECIRGALANGTGSQASTLQIHSERNPKNDTKHTLAYRCVISANGRTFETPYTTGKGNVPVAMREAYRPSLGSVLWALFRDADGIEDHEDWVSWAAELGHFSGTDKIPLSTTADRIVQIRKSMSDFVACSEAHFFLRAVFGASYERLMSLSLEV